MDFQRTGKGIISPQRPQHFKQQRRGGEREKERGRERKKRSQTAIISLCTVIWLSEAAGIMSWNNTRAQGERRADSPTGGSGYSSLRHAACAMLPDRHAGGRTSSSLSRNLHEAQPGLLRVGGWPTRGVSEREEAVCHSISLCLCLCEGGREGGREGERERERKGRTWLRLLRQTHSLFKDPSTATVCVIVRMLTCQ